MKKILFGLIALALLVGMTGVVSAAAGDYCKVTGGGTVVDYYFGNDMGITVSFTAQGTCWWYPPAGWDSDVKGKVTIVNHATKEKSQLDVIGIYECEEFNGGSVAVLYLDDYSFLLVFDSGEGANADPDLVAHLIDSGTFDWEGCLSGNAQVKITAQD